MILVGDTREQMRTLPEGSAQCCVTSPPYWGLRDYGVDGQLGLEKTPDEYVAAMVDVFREVRRVLRDDGTLWLNLGDSYAGGGGYAPNAPVNQRRVNGESWGKMNAFSVREGEARTKSRPGYTPPGLKPKDLVGIPWRVAFALQADGWYLRSDIIWAKPNPMPESVTDRPTKAHEYVFLLSKSARYYYDADAVKEARRSDNRAPLKPRPDKATGPNARGGNSQWETGLRDETAARNKRSVWTVTTQPYPGAHFAVMPPKLVEPCILAGSPVKACAECGAPYVRLVERASTGGTQERAKYGQPAGRMGHKVRAGSCETVTTGFEPSCECSADTKPAAVLDPFAGTATVGVVAFQHGRQFVGCELNPEYAELARQRLDTEAGQSLLFTPMGEVAP